MEPGQCLNGHGSEADLPAHHGIGKNYSNNRESSVLYDAHSAAKFQQSTKGKRSPPVWFYDDESLGKRFALSEHLLERSNERRNILLGNAKPDDTEYPVLCIRCKITIVGDNGAAFASRDGRKNFIGCALRFGFGIASFPFQKFRKFNSHVLIEQELWSARARC